jgi:hypothetical protein
MRLKALRIDRDRKKNEPVCSSPPVRSAASRMMSGPSGRGRGAAALAVIRGPSAAGLFDQMQHRVRS